MHYDETIEIGGTPGCGYCQRLRKMGDQDGEGWTCDAFPDGIPSSIVLNDNAPHDEVYPGDNGLRYLPRIIVPEGKKVGYYFDWDGTAHDAETHSVIERYDQVR